MPPSFSLQFLFDKQFVYIATNILTGGLCFLRNVLFMRLMGQGDLGQIALMQTISMSVGLLQFGLINGGYRIYAIGDSKTNRCINNNVFTCLTLLAALLLIGLLFAERAGLTNGSPIYFEAIVFGIATGIVTLSSTWTNNTLVAEGRLGLSNLINMVAVIGSLLVAVFAGKMGLYLALLAVLIQPVLVTLLALIFNPAIRPKPELSKKILLEILALGFFPFCAGVLTLVNMQIERWFIIFDMGDEPLGRYYIVMIYAMIFSMVPVSLLNLYFPNAISAYDGGKKMVFWNIVRRHLRALLLYIIALVVLTVALLGWALDHFLVNFRGQERLVFLSLPGLVALTFFDSAALMLQATRRMLPIFLFSAIALVINLVLLAGAVAIDKLSLEFVAIAKSVGYIIAGLIIMLPLLFCRKNLFSVIESR
jgi:O-antigen/teichoic acid export membrane protein